MELTSLLCERHGQGQLYADVKIYKKLLIIKKKKGIQLANYNN